MASKEEHFILEITDRTSNQQRSVTGGPGANDQCILRLENSQEIRAQATTSHPPGGSLHLSLTLCLPGDI